MKVNKNKIEKYLNIKALDNFYKGEINIEEFELILWIKNLRIKCKTIKHQNLKLIHK